MRRRQSILPSDLGLKAVLVVEIRSPRRASKDSSGRFAPASIPGGFGGGSGSLYSCVEFGHGNRNSQAADRCGGIKTGEMAPAGENKKIATKSSPLECRLTKFWPISRIQRLKTYTLSKPARLDRVSRCGHYAVITIFPRAPSCITSSCALATSLSGNSIATIGRSDPFSSPAIMAA